MGNKLFAARLTARQEVLVARSLRGEEWPASWTLGDRLAWVLEYWQRNMDQAAMPKVDDPVR